MRQKNITANLQSNVNVRDRKKQCMTKEVTWMAALNKTYVTPVTFSGNLFKLFPIASLRSRSSFIRFHEGARGNAAPGTDLDAERLIKQGHRARGPMLRPLAQPPRRHQTFSRSHRPGVSHLELGLFHAKVEHDLFGTPANRHHTHLTTPDHFRITSVFLSRTG